MTRRIALPMHCHGHQLRLVWRAEVGEPSPLPRTMFAARLGSRRQALTDRAADALSGGGQLVAEHDDSEACLIAVAAAVCFIACLACI